MLTIGTNDDSGVGMTGDAPKPVSLGLDGPRVTEWHQPVSLLDAPEVVVDTPSKVSC